MKKFFLLSFITMFAIGVFPICVGCSNDKIDNTWSKQQIKQVIENSSRLATTAVSLQKVVIWDSNDQEYAWGDFNKNAKNWFGSQRFIFPINVEMNFGYDLSNFSSKSIEIDGSTLTITLPKPKLIDSSIQPFNKDEVYNMSSGLRDGAGRSKLEDARNKQHEFVLSKSDSILNMVHSEVLNNTRQVLMSVLQGSGYDVEIVEKD